MNETVKRWLPIAVIVAGIAGIVAVGAAAQTGSDTAIDVPDYVEELLPPPGSEVLSQTAIGIRMDTGFTGYLVINGVNVRDEVEAVPERGLVQYQVGPGRGIEELQDRNCVVAHVWPVLQGEDESEQVSWCFGAL